MMRGENLPEVRPQGLVTECVPAAEIKARVSLIAECMRSVMIRDVHYGLIPGCGDRPSLLKPGAEKIAVLFQIRVDHEVMYELLTDEEVSYRVRATAKSRDGAELGCTEGVCSTREKKYRWRAPVHPKEWEAQPEHRRRVFWKKNGDEYIQVRTDPGEMAHTILSMAEKRAFVAVIKLVTGASDIFAQAEDAPDDEPAPIKQPNSRPQGSPPEGVSVTGAEVAKKGEGAKGPWTLYKITLSDGRVASTFSDSVYETAQQAMADALAVEVRMSPGKKEGQLNLDSLELI
ncbi:MAG: hypothetical protein WC986_13520 [Elusimicrobiota bacterium]|jgi:hypothetical protein